SQSQYFGSQRWELYHEGISLSEYDYLAPGTPWHYHENPYFMYVIKGNMLDIGKAGSAQLPPGSLMFLNWEETHRTEKHSATNGRGFHLQVERTWLQTQGIHLGLWEGNQVLNHPDFHLLLSKIYYEFRRADAFSMVAIELMVLELCSSLTERFKLPPKGPPPWMEALKTILHEGTSPLSLTALSAELGVHPVHISRTVPLFLDTTLGDYLRKLRISKSLPLILGGEQPLTQIAFACGFSDQSHFTRTFKSYFGQTPSAFQRGNRLG
ncbi:MAG: AraC family transcriptional regulator, partial [Bacteroidota bacterium]